MTLSKVRGSMVEDTLKVQLFGRFDFEMGSELRTVWEESMETANRFVVDLSQVSMIESSALGMLLLLRREVGDETADITLCRPNEDVRWALEIAQFHKLFKLEEECG